MAKISAKDRIRQFLIDHVGQVVTSDQIRAAAGISEWARRVRELRDEERMPIHSHHDDASLKPGEYRLTHVPEEKSERRFVRGISNKLKAYVIDRDGATCQMCGLEAGKVNPASGRRVHMQVGHIVDKSLGGQDVADNLKALCSSCNEGAKNITMEKPVGLGLLSYVRRAPLDEQRVLRDWLNNKFRDA